MGWLRTAVASGAPSAVSGASNSRHQSLRAGLAALALILLAPAGAVAADMPEFLRGSYSPSYTRWDGLYFGAQLGVANADTDFSKATSDFVSYSLRETTLEKEVRPSDWSVLPSQIAHGRSYGAFLGYNFQWDQLVVGAEVAYNRASGLDSSVLDGMTRVVAPSNGTDTVSVGGQASMKLQDYATFRARAGYAVGQFLPYAFIGGAVGQFDYKRDLILIVTGVDNGSFTLSDGKNNAIVAGFTTGLGMDVALTPNVFLRGEWEFVGFVPVHGIRANINTARAGLGMKF